MRIKHLALLIVIIWSLAVPLLVLAQDTTIVTTTTNLRVRSQPRVEAPSLQVAPRGTTMLALGRNADTSWIQVEYKGVIGWASIAYLATNDNLAALPVTDATDPTVTDRPEERSSAPDGTLVNTGELIVFSTTAEVNVRILPNESADVIGKLAPNERATVTLLDPTRLWGQINFQGTQGWVALYVVNVLGDIRTIEVLGDPATSSEMPLGGTGVFSLEQRAIVQTAQDHLARYIPEASGLIDIFTQAVNSGLIACGPVPDYLKDYRPLRTDYARVPELEAYVLRMNEGFKELNRVRAQWLNACGTTNTLLYRNRFPEWLATAQAGAAKLDEAQRGIAELLAR